MNRTIVLAMALGLSAVGSAKAVTVTWTGGGDGLSVLDAANWSPAVVPGVDDDVVFSSGTPVIDVGGLAVRTLTTSRSLSVARSESGLPLPLTIGGSIVLNNSASIIVSSSDPNVALPSLVFNGTTSISGSGTIGLESPRAAVRITGTLNVGPEVVIANVNGSGHDTTIRIDQGSRLVNQGLIQCVGAGNVISFHSYLTSNPNFVPRAEVNNSGTIKAGNGGTVQISEQSPVLQTSYNDDLRWTNTGEFVADNGTVRVRGGYSSVGTFVRANSGKIILGGLPTPGLTLSPQADGQPYVLGTSHPGSAVFHNLTLLAPAVLSGDIVNFSGTLALASGATITPVTSGELAVASILTITGSGQILAGGRLRAGAATQLFIGSLIEVRSSILLAGGTLTNFGLIQADTAAISVSPFGTLINNGVIEARNGQQVSVGSGVTWTNNGVVRASTNGTVSLNGSYNVTGTIATAAGGQVYINGRPNAGATITAPQGGMTVSDPVTWDRVTLSGRFMLTGCGRAVVTNGLTMMPGTENIIDVNGCTVQAMQFQGNPQTLGGAGVISFANSGGRIDLESNVTFGPDVAIQNGNADVDIYVRSGRQLINQGTLSVSGAGRALNVGVESPGSTQLIRNQGTIQVVDAATATLPIVVENAGLLRVGPGSSVTVPQGASITQTAAGRLQTIINGPDPFANVGRLLIAGSFVADGAVEVGYQSYSPASMCLPAVLIVKAQGNGADIGGEFASQIVPATSASLLPRVRSSPPGIYFASTIVGDVSALGGYLVPDGQITTDDLISYLDVFFAGVTELADVASSGGVIGADGVLSADDMVAYLQSFFEGCP